QPFEVGKGFNKTKREFLPCLSERQLGKPGHIGEASDVVQLVKGNMEAPQRLEVSQKTEVSPDSAMNVELDVRPIGDQSTRLLQLRRREGLIKLNDPAIRLQRPVGVANRSTTDRSVVKKLDYALSCPQGWAMHYGDDPRG